MPARSVSVSTGSAGAAGAEPKLGLSGRYPTSPAVVTRSEVDATPRLFHPVKAGTFHPPDRPVPDVLLRRLYGDGAFLPEQLSSIFDRIGL
ncbi:hypothetical protein [Nitrobacter sp. JJSN]|uniref:hypothetical protein n=1 Tax=Nitrobacter sp. JJSN TaxID=3453033 RepID=UPI003F7641EE